MRGAREREIARLKTVTSSICSVSESSRPRQKGRLPPQLRDTSESALSKLPTCLLDAAERRRRRECDAARMGAEGEGWGGVKACSSR